jgi:hypothetical protein
MRRNHRYALIFVVVVVAAAALIAWVPGHRPPAPSRPMLKEIQATPPATVAAPSARERSMHAPATPPRDWPDYRTPVDEAVRRLHEWADGGDAKAGIQLSSLLRQCTAHELRGAQASDERDRADIAEDATNEKLTDAAHEGRRANSQRRIDDNAARREACGRIPQDLVTHWLDPLDRAAQSGDLDAMREYARVAMVDYEDTAAVVANVDEAITRRDKARAYLDEALRRGDSAALVDLANAYSESTTTNLYSADAMRTHAYAYAATLSDLRGLAEYDRHQMSWLLGQSAETLDATALARAEAEGRRIYEQCCAGH